MNKQEVIEFLEKRRNAAFDGMERFAVNTDLHTLHGARVYAYDIAIDKVKQIEEPKQDKPVVKPFDELQDEKVEVPDFVADWIDYAKKKGHGVIESAQPWDLYGAEWSKADRWIKDNEEIYARAYLDGYTIEPKRWVVRQGGSEVWYLQGFRNSLDGDIVKQWCSYEGCIKFTDRKKAEAVATLVDGSVEEV